MIINNNYFIYIKTLFTTLYKAIYFKLNNILSGSIQRVFTLKSFIIMSGIHDNCSQKSNKIMKFPH
jgi:hypothetical protein